MKVSFIIFLIFCHTLHAQKNRGKVVHIPQPPLKLENKVDPEELWNSSLKGSKWYFDVKNFNKDYLLLDNNISKTNTLTFIDDQHFQLKIDNKDCKAEIKGSYNIFKGESVFGTHSFDIRSPHQKCTKEIHNLLSGLVLILYDGQKKIIEIKRGEHPPSLPVQ